MTVLSSNGPVGCPGCLATPVARLQEALPDAKLALSLPSIHCQICIGAVENCLVQNPGVRAARVNLTRKRVMIDAAPDVAVQTLIDCLKGEGFQAHELDPAVLSQTQTDAAGRDILMRVAVAGFAAMNVMLLSVAVWSGATDATRDLFHWISAAITVPALAFSAQPFFRNAWAGLRVKRLNMDVPISLAIFLALVTSLWETRLSGEHAYFDAALALTFFLLAGRWLEARARSAARSAAEELTALEVSKALLSKHGKLREVPIAELRLGDFVLVRPGARIPVDGVVIEGASEVDRSALTGETIPVLRLKGDQLHAGEVNLTGPLTLKATAVGLDTSLHKLAALVAVAESGRSQYTSLADKAAKLYAPGVHLLAAVAFWGWLLWSGDMRVALNIAAAVLIITCPCALGLAVPAVTTAASGRLFKKGLLIKNATALERLAQVDIAVFDKTGTVTLGTPRLTNWHQLKEHQKAIAYALSSGSSHPLAAAITRKAEAEHIVPAKLSKQTECPGYGTSAVVVQSKVRLGRLEWIGGQGNAGGVCTALDCGDGEIVVLEFEDRMRPGAADLMRKLQDRGIKVMLLSGDRAVSVKQTAKELGKMACKANVTPSEKVDVIRDLSARGHRVLMIGDGLNDTGALASAHVSISPAQAMDAARAASDIVLLGENLLPVGDAVATARQSRKRITENFRIATIYNIVAVPLAVAGMATPLIAALAMSASSLTVSLNALRVRGRL
ncbi:MAG: heavy metal translocating P-type ATPase [Roseobacter sp.]